MAPDVFVVLGASKQDRSSYLLWEEPKVPDFVMEITSKSTRSEDQGVKRGLYAYLGVREYFLYDPTHDYLEPALQGFRLEGDRYQLIPLTVLPDGTLALASAVLGLEARLVQGMLRFYDPARRQLLLTHAEAEAQAGQEAAARQAAETRVAELEARLQALQADRPAANLPEEPPPHGG